MLSVKLAVVSAMIATATAGVAAVLLCQWIAWNNLIVQGAEQSHMRDFQHAVKSFEQAAAMARTQKRNDRLWTSLCGQGNALVAQGQFSAAERCYKLVLQDNYEVGESSNCWLARGLQGIGRVYIGQSKYPEAESTFRRALDIFQRARDTDYPDVANTLDGLAIAVLSQGGPVD